LDYAYSDGIPLEPPDLHYRKEINELKTNGTIVCFEGQVATANEMQISNTFYFDIKLVHDPQIANKLGIILF